MSKQPKLISQMDTVKRTKKKNISQLSLLVSTPHLVDQTDRVNKSREPVLEDRLIRHAIAKNNKCEDILNTLKLFRDMRDKWNVDSNDLKKHYMAYEKNNITRLKHFADTKKCTKAFPNGMDYFVKKNMFRAPLKRHLEKRTK